MRTATGATYTKERKTVLEHTPTHALRAAFTLSIVLAFATSSGATRKIVDKILFHSTKVNYRWSEGSTINLDGKNHLMMTLTLFGAGGHDSTASQILEFHSHDGGLTWPTLKQARVLQKNVGKQNTMSPSLLKLDNGDILCFVMVKNSIRDSGAWVKRSTDGGKSWGKLRKLPYEGYGGAGSDRAIQISTGRVLLPCWFSNDSLKSTRLRVCYSDDRGNTWKQTAVISTPKGTTGRRTDPAAEEPMIIELKDGRLMMVIRVYLKSIYKCYSSDGGATWTKPESTGIPAPGSMSTIKRLPNGDILLVWNWAPVEKISGPWPRNHISAAISKDDGKNFSSVRHLDGAPDFAGKITMANVAFAHDDKVVITYSKSMTKKNAYNWRLQVIPLAWFYEGDTSQVYGEKYLPTLESKLAKAKPSTPKRDEPPAPKLRKPSAADRKAALTTMAKLVAEDAKQEGLVAAYHFEEGSGTFAFDTSKAHNDLAVQAAGSFPKWVDGRVGKALEFNGKAGYLAASDAKSLHSAQFTLEGWVYPTARKKHSIIATKEHSWEVGLNGGRLEAAVRSGGSWGIGWVGSTPIPLNKWTQFAVTFDGRRLRTFVNGNCTKSLLRGVKMDITKEPLVVGGCTHISDSVFAGRIDELTVWNIARYAPAQEPGMQDKNTPPRRIGATHQLFIDDGLIAHTEGLRRVVNQPVKHHDNPVLTYEHPWEGNCVITWGSVLYEPKEKLFKVWYEVYKKFPKHGDGTIVCYATSTDGIHWDKPKLGIYDYFGTKANNIVFWLKGKGIDAPTILPEPHPTADVKYRMYFHQRGGIYTATSPDGIHWTVLDRSLINAGDRNSAHYDPARKKTIVITRIPGRGMRTCGLWESDNGVDFKHVQEIVAPDDNDPEKTQLYGMIYFNYAGLRLGFLEMFYIPTRLLDTQLVYSRDGLEWARACDRQVFLPLGGPGSWDQAWVTPSQNPPIRIGDKLYIFYQGRQTLHWAVAPYGHIGSVGLAFLRPDGFVSLDAQCEEGCVTTAPLLLDGTALHINAFARPGAVAAEITDLDGNPLEGYGRGDCVPLEMADRLDHAVAWKGGRTLAPLKGKPVRLRFWVRGTKLYSFWME